MARLNCLTFTDGLQSLLGEDLQQSKSRLSEIRHSNTSPVRTEEEASSLLRAVKKSIEKIYNREGLYTENYMRKVERRSIRWLGRGIKLVNM